MKNIFVLILFICTVGFAQEPEVKADLTSPYTTIYTHLYFLQSDSYQPEKAAITIYGYIGKQAEQKAIKLKKILDGKGLRVDMSKLPKNANFVDTVGIRNKNIYVLFPNKVPEIYLEKVAEKWYYSAHTIAQIDDLYNDVYPWGTTFLKKIIPESFHKTFFGIEVWQYFGFILLLFLGFIIFIFLNASYILS